MVQAVIPTTVTGLQGRPVANTAPTQNQALAWTGSAWGPSGPYLTAAGAPYHATNYVDNSGFTINQRGYTSGTAFSGAAYNFDRWKSGASGVTLTFTPSPASTVVTIAAGTLQQIIEGASFINSTYTLSWLGSATGRVNAGAYTASPISFTGAPNTNVTIEFQGGTLGQVQLQLGNQVTLWQPRPPQQELAACQRFYVSGGVLGIAGFQQNAGYGIGCTVSYPVQMRAVPTIVLNAVSSTNAGSPTTPFAGLTNFMIQALNIAAGAMQMGLTYVASADL